MTVLQAIRIYGPCDAFEVQKRTGINLDDVVDAMTWHQQNGFIFCTGASCQWDVTKAGRDSFAASFSPAPVPTRPVRRWLRRAS